MNRNKKGFTLIEVLAVIIILAVIAGLIIPNIKRYRDRGNKEYYDKLKDNVILAAKDYFSNHPEELPRGQMGEEKDVEGNTHSVLIYNMILDANKLVDGNYLTNQVADENGNNCITNKSNIIVRNNGKNSYSYGLCDICSSKIENDKDCNVANLNEMLYCEVEDVIKVDEKKKEIILRHNGDGVMSPLEDNNTSSNILIEIENGKPHYYVTSSGNYTFEVYRGDSTVTCSTTIINKVVDEEKPKCTVELSKTSNTQYEYKFSFTDNYAIKKISDNKGRVYNSFACGSVNEETFNVSFDRTNETTQYILQVEDCNGNKQVCPIVIVPAKATGIDDNIDNPTVCEEGSKTILTGFSNCAATCVNGAWKCDSKESCVYSCDSSKNYYKTCNGVKTIVEYNSSECGSTLSCVPNKETTSGGKCYKCKTDGSGYSEIACPDSKTCTPGDIDSAADGCTYKCSTSGVWEKITTECNPNTGSGDYCTKADENKIESIISCKTSNGVAGTYVGFHGNGCDYAVCTANCTYGATCKNGTGTYNENCKCELSCTKGGSCMTDQGAVGKYNDSCKCVASCVPKTTCTTSTGLGKYDISCVCKPLSSGTDTGTCTKTCASGFTLNEKTCTCECNKTCGSGKYLDQSTCKCKSNNSCNPTCKTNQKCVNKQCVCNLSCTNGVANRNCTACSYDH